MTNPALSSIEQIPKGLTCYNEWRKKEIAGLIHFSTKAVDDTDYWRKNTRVCLTYCKIYLHREWAKLYLSQSTELCMFGQLDVGVTHLFKHFGLKPLQSSRYTFSHWPCMLHIFLRLTDVMAIYQLLGEWHFVQHKKLSLLLQFIDDQHSKYLYCTSQTGLCHAYSQKAQSKSNKANKLICSHSNTTDKNRKK